MERRAEGKRRRRELILAAAEELFRTQGFYGVTMDRVAEHAGISKRTLYAYFARKEELIYACVREGFEAFDRYLESQLDAADTGMEKLLVMGKAHRDFRKDERYYHGAIAYSLFTVTDSNGDEGPEYRSCRQWIEGMYKSIEKLLRLGGEDGSIRRDIDPHRLSFAIGAMINGLFVQERRMTFLKEIAGGYDSLIDEGYNMLKWALSPERE